MLLARKGYKVLVVARATFPSDTLSTHIVHPPGVAALQRWGLLDRLTATGCPPIDTYTFDFGPFTLSGAPGTDDSPVSYCPRRTVLDKLLVVAGWPYAEFEANKNDVEGNYMKMFELAPEFAERMRDAKREARFAGTAV